MDATAGSIGTDRLRIASYFVAGIALTAAIVAGRLDLPFALLPLAVLLGWSHLHSV
jgi:hypothetical protein